MSCDRRFDLGAYMLGVLTPDEADEMAEHLTGCEACADELGELAWLPDMLLRVPHAHVEQLDARLTAREGALPGADDATPDGAAGTADTADTGGAADTAADPSPALLDRLLARTRAERRSRTRRLVIAAVAAVVIGTGAGVAATSPLLQPHPSTVTAVDPHTRVSATISVTARTWGSALALSVRGAYPGGVCSLIAYSRDGRAEVAATWVASPRGTADVPGATSIPADQLAHLDVVSAGRHLVRIDLPTHR